MVAVIMPIPNPAARLALAGALVVAVTTGPALALPAGPHVAWSAANSRPLSSSWLPRRRTGLVRHVAAEKPTGLYSQWYGGADEEAEYAADSTPGAGDEMVGDGQDVSDTQMLSELVAAQRLHAQASQATPHYFDKFAEPWMPTTADMLDDLLRAALEFEQPHMREKRDEFVEAYFERFSEPLMPTTSAMLNELLDAARHQQTTTIDGRSISVGTQLEELLREADNEHTREALDHAMAREQVRLAMEEAQAEAEAKSEADSNIRNGGISGGAGEES